MCQGRERLQVFFIAACARRSCERCILAPIPSRPTHSALFLETHGLVGTSQLTLDRAEHGIPTSNQIALHFRAPVPRACDSRFAQPIFVIPAFADFSSRPTFDRRTPRRTGLLAH